MKLKKSVEDKLLSFVRKTFLGDEWTFRHTLSCVNIMKNLISAEGGNEMVLIPAIYLHDVGYAEKLRDGYTLADRLGAKKVHMDLGAKMAQEFLPSLGFSKSEVEEICHLIRVHDVLDGEKSFEESLILEADSLGAIDPSVGSNFNEEDYADFVKKFDEKRAPKFITITGKNMLKKFAHENKIFLKYTKLF